MEEAEKTQVEDKPKPRTVDQLKDVPYSEMTDEEIESVVTFKAQNLARDSAYQEQQEIVYAAMMANVARWRDIADKADERLDEMRKDAQARLDAACGMLGGEK